MSRKRINISVDEETYEELQGIRKRYGFKNLCEISVAMLHLLSRYIHAAEHRCSRHEESTDETITNMFNEMGQWETTPDDVTPYVHHHHKTIKED